MDMLSSGPCGPDVGPWAECIKSRLLWLVGDEHRQHVIKMFTERLRNTVQVWSNRYATSSSEDTMLACSCDIFLIHQMRMRTTHRHAKGPGENPETQDKSTLLKKMNSLLDLLNWLLTTFWSDSLPRSSTISDHWSATLMEIMSSIHQVETLNLPDKDLQNSLTKISETLRSYLTEEDLSKARRRGTVTEDKRSSWMKPRNSKEMMMYVDARMEHYDAILREIVNSPIHQEDPQWVPFLEKNKDLLLDESVLSTLFSAVECLGGRQKHRATQIIKLLLGCLSRLPLPIFLNQHKGLWSSPDRMRLCMDHLSEEYDLYLNETFNKMTSADTTKLAVQIGCLVLQKPGTTLERLLHHVTQNQESMGTLCQVLQCLPQLRETEFLFVAVSKCLQFSRWSKTEENNLINFTVMLCQQSVFPYDLSLPAMEPPMLSCNKLLVRCILPSLLIQGCSGADQALPLDRTLRLMSGLLKTAVLPTPLLYTAVMCLCELLECMLSDDAAHCSVETRESVLEALLLVCAKISALKTHDNESYLTKLWDNLTDFHWSTRLRISYHLQGIAPCLQKYYSDHLGAMQVLLHTLADKKGELGQEEMLYAWYMILSASSISRSIAEQYCQIITDAFTADTFPLSVESLVMSLAGYLPSCTVTEWRNALVTVRRLVSSVLDIPYTSHFTCYLPANVDDILADLSISQVMLSLLQVTSNGWENTIKCYMATMQEVLTRNSEDDRRSQHSRLFLAGQVFCHACCAMQLVPSDHGEALIVLGCEMLGQMEGLERSEVNQWGLIQRDMLEVAAEQDALLKKIKDLG